MIARFPKHLNGIYFLFDCSTRDGSFAKVQNCLGTGVMNVAEREANICRQILKDTIPQF